MMLHKLPLVKSRGAYVLLCTIGACYLRSNLRCVGDSSVSPPDGEIDPGGKLPVSGHNDSKPAYICTSAYNNNPICIALSRKKPHNNS